MSSKARDAVAFLRVGAGRFPDDPALAGLIGEPDQTLVTYSAALGSESASSLRLLASWYLTDRR